MTAEPSPSKTRSTAAALAAILPVVLTSVASFVESRSAKADVASQSERHQLDEARTDIWIREQWVVQTQAIADLKADVAELRGRVARERRRTMAGDDRDDLLGGPGASGVAAAAAPALPIPVSKPIMPEKPSRDTELVRKVAREMKQ